MEPLFDSSGRPVPEAFREAVEDFADAMDVPAGPLLQGEGFMHGDVVFWLKHYSDEDPQGLTVIMDLGPPPASPGALARVMRRFLEYHAAAPVSRQGLYGYLPQLKRFVYCRRLALDEIDDDDYAQAIAIVMATHVELGRAMRDALEPPAAPVDSAAATSTLRA